MSWLRRLAPLLPEPLRHSFVRSRIRLGDGAPSHYTFKLAETRDELEQAFAVLHDAYVGQGYMKPHPSGLRVTKYHALPTTAVLIAKDTRTGEVVATVSIVRSTALGLPLDTVFPLGTIKQKYRHLAEVSSLAIRREHRKEPADLFWPLLRYFYIYIREVMRVDAYVVGVNPLWHDLYAGILGFSKIEGFESDTYGFANDAPVSAYLVEVMEQEHLLYKFYSHLPKESNFYDYCRRGREKPEQYVYPNRRFYSVQNTVMNRELLDYFFNEKTDAMDRFSEEERSIIQQYYPFQTYSSLIWGDRKDSVGNLRSSERFITRLGAAVMMDGSFENDVRASVLDCSMHGLKLESSVELPRHVQLRIGLGPYDSAYVNAEVRRRHNGAYGLRITRCDAAWKELITEMQKGFWTGVHVHRDRGPGGRAELAACS